MKSVFEAKETSKTEVLKNLAGKKALPVTNIHFDTIGGKMVSGIDFIDEHRYIPRSLAIFRQVGNLRLVGETGTGKTTLVYALAQKLGLPLHEVVLTRDISRWDLLATDILEKGNTQTRKGIVVQWLESEGSILYLDGANYCEPSIFSLVESLGDFRGNVYVPELQRVYKRTAKHYLVISFNPAEKSGYCLTEDSLISVDGNQYSFIAELTKGNAVLGKVNNLQTVRNKLTRDYDGLLYRIKGRGILPFQCSEDHKILVVERKLHYKYNAKKYKKENKSYGEPKWIYSNPQWIEAKDLIAYKQKYPFRHHCLVFPKMNCLPTFIRMSLLGDMDREMVYLLGLFVADGSTSKSNNGKVSWCLGSHEKQLIEKVIKLLKKHGYKPYMAKQNNGTRVVVTDRSLKDWLRSEVGTYAWNKRIPTSIMESSKEMAKAFLLGYLDGDGYKSKIGIGFKTTSKVLALQLQKLFSKLDIFMRLETPKTPKTTTIKGRVVKQRQKYVGRTSRYYAVRFGLTYPKTKRPLFTTFGETKDCFYVPIRSIKKTQFKGTLHDITTEDSTLQVNNVVIHNSGTYLMNIATMRRFEGLIVEYLSIQNETDLIKQISGKYNFARKWVEIANKTRTLYKKAKLRTPLTTGNLMNYAKLYKNENLAEEELVEIAKSLYPEEEQETFARLFETSKSASQMLQQMQQQQQP